MTDPVSPTFDARREQAFPVLAAAEIDHIRRFATPCRYADGERIYETGKESPGMLVSRPSADIPRIFARRAVGLLGASPGRFGTVLSQTAWQPVFRTLGMRPWFGELLYVGGAGKLFDPAGNLIDEPTRTRLRSYLKGFADFIKKE